MTTEIMQKHREPFYGRVIDGPFEGEWIESDSPYFVGHFRREVRALLTDWSAGIEIDRAYYKWLPSYRAWAWWQPSKPPEPRKR